MLLASQARAQDASIPGGTAVPPGGPTQEEPTPDPDRRADDNTEDRVPQGITVDPALRIEIDSGIIEGFSHREPDLTVVAKTFDYREGDVRIFRGIPYAASPIGAFRWKSPQPCPRWTGVRSARRYGPECLEPSLQFNIFRRFNLDNVRNQSEDCLYANVYTTAPPKTQTPLPVIVFFHGGGFTVGAGSDNIYDGSNLARQGVVVVTFNYRLGPFGFLAHPDLSAESPRGVSGNYGLEDQIFLLKWVQRNIAAFGGDPANITAMGHGSGAGSVIRLMTCPDAQGLIQKAILQSPGALTPRRFLRQQSDRATTAEQSGLDLQDRMGLNSIREMRDLDARVLLAAAAPVITGPGEKYGPVVDGVLQPEDPMAAWEAGKQAPIPIVIGNNADDGVLFLRPRMGPESVQQYEQLVKDAFGDKTAASLLKLFPAPNDQQARATARRLMTAVNFLYPARQLVDAHLKQKKADVFEYHFTRTSSYRWSQRSGAYYGFQLFYSFANVPGGDLGFIEEDRATARQMTHAWASFARTGKPALPDDEHMPTVVWPPSGPTHPTLEFGEEIKLLTDPAADVLRSLDDLKTTGK